MRLNLVGFNYPREFMSALSPGPIVFPPIDVFNDSGRSNGATGHGSAHLSARKSGGCVSQYEEIDKLPENIFDDIKDDI